MPIYKFQHSALQHVHKTKVHTHKDNINMQQLKMDNLSTLNANVVKP